jgi:protein arginine N-methyltransferase 1
MSSDVTLPERVDAIVCDQIGHFGVEAGLVEYGADARDRFLKPGGIMLPARIDLFVAPVEASELFDQVQFWTRRPGGFDFVPARRWAANTGYPTHLPRKALLGGSVRAHQIEMATITPAPFSFNTALTVERAGTLHGLGGWFSAQLSSGTVLSNGPDANPRLYRRNVFFPIDAPVAVDAGDVVEAQMRVMPAEVVVTWTVDVWRAGASRLASDRKGHFRHSTLNGMLLSREDLRRMDPRFVPSLTARGVARQSVLALCDGRRTIAEIEREVQRRHPDLFKSVAEAGAFVSEVVTRYSE